MTRTSPAFSRLIQARFLPHTLLAVGVLVAVCATFGGVSMPVAPPTKGDKERVIAGATPLVNAIRAYEKAHATPPTHLEDLIPRYLERLPMPPADLCVGDYLYAAEEEGWHIGVSLRGNPNRLLTYSSRADYPPGKPSAPVERVGAWAYFDSTPY